MEKIYLHDMDNGVLRYTIKDGEPWFLINDINKALNCTSSDYTDGDDVITINYINKVGKEDTSRALNLYAVGHIISILMMRNDKDSIKAFKHEVYNKLLPNMRRNCVQLSDEDIAVLKIFNAKSTMDKVDAINEFKNAVITTRKDTDTPKRKKRNHRVKNTNINIHPLKDVNAILGLKRGQLLSWANNNGYFKYQGDCGRSPHISRKGLTFFGYYGNRCVGVTDAGYELAEKYIDEIKSTKCRMEK